MGSERPVILNGHAKIYTPGPEGEWQVLAEVDSFEINFARPGSSSDTDSDSPSGT